MTGDGRHMEGRERTWGWEGPVGTMIAHAVMAGCYEKAIRANPVRERAFRPLAEDRRAAATALAVRIGMGSELAELSRSTRPKTTSACPR